VNLSPVSLAVLHMAGQLAPDAGIVLLHAFELPGKDLLSIASPTVFCCHVL
jgi:hypothetical protein